MKHKWLILFLVVLIACKKEPDKRPDPVACFTWSPDTLIHLGDTVRFENCSENAESFEWAFGDTGTSIDSDPIHAFDSIGEFDVTRIAYGDS